MLQTLISDRKAKADASAKTAEQLPEQEQSSQLMGGTGRSPQSHSLQQRNNLAVLQKAYGNQAVLRMKGRLPVANPLQVGVLQRKCACGNGAGSSGSCAKCQSKQESILQTKLQIGEAGDRYEQEADRIADPVLRMSEPSSLLGLPIHSITGIVSPHSQLTRSMTGTSVEDGAVNDGSGDAESSFVKPDESPGVNLNESKLPGSPSACVFQAALPYSRSGIIRSASGTVGERFEVRANWSSAPAASRDNTSYCAAECGEYHQFVKGHALASSEKDGSNLADVSAKIFGGKQLDENTFLEDGLNRNPKARYGHRSEPKTMDEEYKPDRATGTEYIGRDFPSVVIGTFADIDLTFLGKLVDTCNKNETFSDTWQVKYRGVIRP